MALITSDYFNTQMATLGLKAKFTPEAEALDVLIQEASDWVEGYCDRVFASTEYVEAIHYPWRSRTPTAVLENWPVTEVTDISWEDQNGMTGDYDPDTVWIDPAGTLTWKNPTFNSWFGTLRYTITYKAGYETIPSNVQRATALKVANLMQPQYQGVQEREVFMVSNLEAMIVDLLEPFRRERFG
jgi:hypothetical protein